MMSASTLAPVTSRTPFSVNVSICPVTTDAVPSRMARNRSPSGTMHIRWSHGSYGGLKCSSTGIARGQQLDVEVPDHLAGRLRASAGRTARAVTWRVMFSHRVIAYPRSSPSSLVSRALSLSRDGTGST